MIDLNPADTEQYYTGLTIIAAGTTGDVRSIGVVIINKALRVLEPLAFASGVTIQGALTAQGTSLSVTAGTTQVQGLATIDTTATFSGGSFTVTTGGMTVNGALMTVNGGTVSITGAVSVPTAGADLTVSAGALTISGDVTVADLTTVSGGATFTLVGNRTLTSTTLNVTGAGSRLIPDPVAVADVITMNISGNVTVGAGDKDSPTPGAAAFLQITIIVGSCTTIAAF